MTIRNIGKVRYGFKIPKSSEHLVTLKLNGYINDIEPIQWPELTRAK